MSVASRSFNPMATALPERVNQKATTGQQDEAAKKKAQRI